MTASPSIRSARAADAPALLAIYRPYVETTAVSFETVVPLSSDSGKPVSKDQFEGTLVGLALGDALGAPFEGGPIERLLWRCIGRTADGKRRWTDDTQMSLDLAASLIANGRIIEHDIAQRFAASYQWRRGYGPGAAKVLKRIRRGMPWRQANRSVFASGSYGNGGAMRAPVIGLYYQHQAEMLEDACQRSAVLTHAHVLGVDGARLIAHATALAVQQGDPLQVMSDIMRLRLDRAFEHPLALAQQWLCGEHRPSPAEVANKLGNGISAVASTPTAVFVALRFVHEPFADMISFVCKGGGDTDTIAAMSGAI